jgi:hypothetical protein
MVDTLVRRPATSGCGGSGDALTVPPNIADQVQLGDGATLNV